MSNWDTLTKRQQDAALEKYRDWEVQDNDWYEGTFDWCKDIAKILGIEINTIGFSGFCSQGDGAHFVGTYHHAPIARLMIRAEQPDDQELHWIADNLHLAQPLPYRVLVGVTHSGRYQHENCCEFTCSVVDEDGYEVDEDEDAGRYGDYLATDPPIIIWDEDDFIEPLKKFMRWIYDKLEAEYDDLTSDEAVIERVNSLDDDEMNELRGEER